MMFVSRLLKQRLQTPTSSYFIDELMNIPSTVNMAPIVPIVAAKILHPSLFMYSLSDSSNVVDRSSTRSARFRTSPLVAGSSELSFMYTFAMNGLLHNACFGCQVPD